MAAQYKIGFLGAGKMATALAKGLVNAELVFPWQIIAADPQEGARKYVPASGNRRPIYPADNREVAKSAIVLVLATKPDQVAAVLEEICGVVTKEHLLISIAAGVTIAKLEQGLPDGARVVRVMPNTPALVGAGTPPPLPWGKSATPADVGEPTAKLLSKAVGLALPVKESLLDAFTGLRGSGPAYVYQFIEALSDGGVAAGLPRDTATRLAAQTACWAAPEWCWKPASIPECWQGPGDQSRGDHAIEGLHELEKGQFRGVVISAVRAATERSRQLGKAS